MGDERGSGKGKSYCVHELKSSSNHGAKTVASIISVIIAFTKHEVDSNSQLHDQPCHILNIVTRKINTIVEKKAHKTRRKT